MRRPTSAAPIRAGRATTSAIITRACTSGYDSACGRTMRRMQRVMGRSDDMLIIKGVNVFPMQIEKVLFEVEGIEPHYQIIVDRENHTDRITVLVEVMESIFFDEMKKQRMVIDRIKSRLASALGLQVEVKLVEEKTLERYEGKAKRVIDRRQL